MQLWSLTGLGRREHGVLVGVLGSICLLLFAITCITDLNHPPGVRTVRLCALALILMFSAVELVWPWRGIALFTLLWPHQILIKYLLARDVSGLFQSIPDLFDWPLAAGLTTAISLRQLRTVPPDPLTPNFSKFPAPLHFLPAAFYAFAIVTLISAAIAFVRLRNAPPSWGVYSADPRNFLLISNPLSFMRVFWVGIPMVVNAAFAIAALRSVLFERTPPAITVLPLRAFLLSMCGAAGIIVHQIVNDWNWSAFDDGAPGGPFSNRNTAAPMLILAAMAALSFVKYRSKAFQTAAVITMIVLSLVAIRTGSRNGALLVLALPWACLLIGAGIWRSIMTVTLPVIVAAAILFWVPIPPSPSVKNDILRRGVSTLEQIRMGDWDAATSYRTQLWQVAGAMWMKYPLFGGGPGTFYIYGARVPETRKENIRSGFVPGIVAHSTPINLLAETGVFGFLIWIFTWLFIPAILLNQRPFSPFALGLFMLGMSNLFDTPWYVSGGITLSVIWLAAAVFQFARTEPHPQINPNAI